MVTVGVAGFVLFSALCGATPTGALAEPWMIVPRAPGRVGRILYPAALAIVVAASPPASAAGRSHVLRHQQRPDGLGPLLGGYLTEWTWRSIFWINIPVAIVALVLIVRPSRHRSPSPSRSTTAARC